jgi:hypothetical protein
MSEVNHCIDLGLPWCIKEIRGKGEWIVVLLGDFIQAAEIDAESEQTILFLDKEDWSSVQQGG